MNIKAILEKQSIFWLIFIGVVLMVYGVYFFLELQSIENTNGVVQMKKVFRLIYEFGGKYTILAIFEVIGIITFISGLKQLKGN